MKKRTIILDKAHGSNVAGKRSPDGSHLEYKWSRMILKEVKRLLIIRGVPVEEIPKGDIEIGLNNRKEKMNLIAAPAFVFSLHNNAAGLGKKWMKAHGAEIYTSPGETQSDPFATIIQQSIVNEIPNAALDWRADFTDGDIDKEARFTVLLSKHPSALFEWKFQDNKSELEILNDSDTNAKLVKALAFALTKISENVRY